MPDMLNTMERARVQWQATIYDGGNPDNIPFVEYDWSRDENSKATRHGINIPEYIIPGVRSANTNWFDAISRNGLIQEHNLSISTGGKNSGSVVSFATMTTSMYYMLRTISDCRPVSIPIRICLMTSLKLGKTYLYQMSGITVLAGLCH